MLSFRLQWEKAVSRVGLPVVGNLRIVPHIGPPLPVLFGEKKSGDYVRRAKGERA
jgi:hypothetical protein